MSILPKELEQLRNGTLHIDCPKMVIKGVDGTVHCTGAGYVRQLQDDGFEIKIFVPEPADTRDIFRPAEFQLGMLISAKEYFTLEANDLGGRTWTADQIITPGRQSCSGIPGHVVIASCIEITSHVVFQGFQFAHGSINLQAFHKIEYPRTRRSKTTVVVGDELKSEKTDYNAATIACCDLTFRIDDGDEQFTLSAESTGPNLHPQVVSRILEALLFALGNSPRWSVLIQTENNVETTRLRSPKRLQTKWGWLRPLNFNYIDQTGHVWRLFGLYLAFILKNAEAAFHPLSGGILAVTRSMDGSVEAQALTAAVEVESLLDCFFKEIGQPDEETLRASGSLVDYLKAWTGNDRVRERVLGSVGQLMAARSGDRLQSLLSQNIVGKQNFTAWKKIRNSAAHGNWKEAMEDLQAFLDKTGLVHVLMYQLVFHLIGYAGKQTDWGTHGWPLIDYPPKAVVENSPGEVKS